MGVKKWYEAGHSPVIYRVIQEELPPFMELISDDI
jgi:hypothetical protein